MRGRYLCHEKCPPLIFVVVVCIIDLVGQALWWSSAVSDQCQLWPLTSGASSKLLQTAFNRSKSAYRSVTMVALQPRSCRMTFTGSRGFACKRTLTLAFLIFGRQGLVVTVAPLSQQQMNSALWRYIMKLQILYRAPLARLLLFGSYTNVLSLISLSSKIHFPPHISPISSSTEQNVWVYLPVCSLLCSRVPYHAL